MLKSKKPKKNFFQKIFIMLARKLGYELVDQANLYLPISKKNLNENLNTINKKSITITQGKVEITRQIKSLCVILRTCTNINMLSQTKKRLFEGNKCEYTIKTLSSIITSLDVASKEMKEVRFSLIIIDHNSSEQDIIKIKSMLSNLNYKNEFISLNIDEFKHKIKKINEENKSVTANQISNMSNIYKSINYAKENCDDLIYFVEDDYIHQKDAISEMLYTYEKISSMIKNELILCPADYPYLYSQIKPTQLILGANKHWRTIEETLCTFLTSKQIITKHWDKLKAMCELEHYPFETPLHEIYKEEYCLSPIPSLAIHCTNINSVYGLSPNINWKKIWEEN